MRLTPEHLSRLIRLKWILMGFGAAAFAAFGVTGGMLADAGWKRTPYVTAPLAIGGWVIAALGVGLHVYDLSRKPPTTTALSQRVPDTEPPRC